MKPHQVALALCGWGGEGARGMAARMGMVGGALADFMEGLEVRSWEHEYGLVDREDQSTRSTYTGSTRTGILII